MAIRSRQTQSSLLFDAVNCESTVVFEEIQMLLPQNWIRKNHRIKHSILDEVITEHVTKLSDRDESFLIGWRQSLKNSA